MARVTVEDCLENVDNRFELVLVASKRARQLAMGKEPLVEEENDKPTVIALREIAEGLIGPEILDEAPEPEVEEVALEEVEEETVSIATDAETDDAAGIDVAAAIKAALGGIGGSMGGELAGTGADEAESHDAAADTDTSEGGE